MRSASGAYEEMRPTIEILPMSGTLGMICYHPPAFVGSAHNIGIIDKDMPNAYAR